MCHCTVIKPIQVNLFHTVILIKVDKIKNCPDDLLKFNVQTYRDIKLTYRGQISVRLYENISLRKVCN